MGAVESPVDIEDIAQELSCRCVYGLVRLPACQPAKFPLRRIQWMPAAARERPNSICGKRASNGCEIVNDDAEVPHGPCLFFDAVANDIAVGLRNREPEGCCERTTG
jgi:hypothetical protein